MFQCSEGFQTFTDSFKYLSQEGFWRTGVFIVSPINKYIPTFWFGLVSLFNGILTFVGHLMPKPFSKKNSSGTI